MRFFVIPQDKANRLRNVSCEPVYAESPRTTHYVINWEIADSRLHNAFPLASRVQSDFRNDG